MAYSLFGNRHDAKTKKIGEKRMSFLDIMTLQGQLLSMIAVGFILARIKVLDAPARKTLANLLFMVVLPCNTFNALGKSYPTEVIVQSGIVIIAATAVEIFATISGPLFFKPFRKEERLVMHAGLINPNPSFVGLPIAAAIYGELGTLYVNMSLLPIRVFIWVVIVMLFERATGGAAAEGGKKENIFIKMLKTPVIIALILGFIRFFLQPTLPKFLDNAIVSFGRCTSPLAMLVIGSVLGSANLRGIFTKATLWFSFVRLVIFPAITFAVLILLKCDPVVTGVVTVIAGTPAGTTTPTLAQKYDCEAGLCAQTVTCSTILMLFTLPIIMMIIPVP
jgi:predicted permease